MSLRPRHLLYALFVAVLANGALVLALARGAVSPRAEPRLEPREVPIVPVASPRRERPRPKRPPETRPQPSKAAPSPPRAELRAPSLPSTFVDPAVGSLAADLGPPGGLGEGEGAADPDAPTVREASEVDRPPEVKSRRLPRYPAAAEVEGTEGLVVLRILIDRTGRVGEARVLLAEPPGVFEDAALAAIRGWRFSPARDEGRPVSVWARQALRFELR